MAVASLNDLKIQLCLQILFYFRTEDSGNYTCVVENGDTLDTISYSLKVQGKSISSIVQLLHFVQILIKVTILPKKLNGSSALSGKMWLVRIIERYKIDAYFKTV